MPTSHPRLPRRAVAIAVAALSSSPLFAEDVQTLAPVQVTGQRLDAARNQLSPETGSTIYRIDRTDIEALPLGASTPLNQVLLQAPGVVQDSFGQLHVRGDHSNLQYRINGVVIPEAISGFGGALDTRFADQINVLTGALPAQYGYRTAGIVDIRTRGTGFDNGGSVTAMGGSHSDAEGSFDYAGSNDAWNYFVTGSFLRNDLGIENPTASRNALHDATLQQKGFAYLSRVIDADSRISLIAGTSTGKFQIPDRPGQTPSYEVVGDPVIDSARLDAKQNESNAFQVATWQSSPTDQVDYQVSVFHRYTDVAYQPDPLGDLVFNGVAAQVLRRNDAYGLQGDFSDRLDDRHTLRAGVFAQRERYSADSSSLVFPADADGNQTSTVPITIDDGSRSAGLTYGVYLQDEWQPVKSLTVNYGARFDHVSTVVNEKQLSPRFGLVYEWSTDTRFHFGYSRYFTPPPTEKIDTTSVAAFLGTTNALPSDANTSVKSERSHYFDIGLSHQATPELTLGVDAYYRKVRDLQDEGQFGNALIFSAFNYDRGRIGGIEFSASYRKGGLTAYANLAVAKAEGQGIVTGQFNFDPVELAYIANHWVHLDHDQALSGSAGTSYQFGSTRVGADLLYGSGLRNGFANTAHLPAYTQVNLSATRTWTGDGIGKIEGRVALINLFDRRFELRDGSGIGVGAPQYGPRRAIYGGVTRYF